MLGIIILFIVFVLLVISALDSLLCISSDKYDTNEKIVDAVLKGCAAIFALVLIIAFA